MNFKISRKLFPFFTALIIFIAFSGCAKEDVFQQQESSEPIQSIYETPENSSPSQEQILAIPSISDLSMLSDKNGLDLGCSTANGYYELDISQNPAVLFYTDYATQQRIPLCGRPECTHSDESCTAVIPGAEGIIHLDGKLFVFCMKQDGSLPVIKMNYDGSERETIFMLNSTDRYDKAFAGTQRSIFTVAEVYHPETDKHVSELIMVDLQEGKIQTLTQLDNQGYWFLVGASGKYLLLKSIKQTGAAPFGSPEAYASQVHELFLYDVQQAFMTSILSWTQGELLDVCYEDKLFLYNSSEATFSVQRFCADGLEPLLISQPLPLQNARDAFFYGLYDGRVVVEMGENIVTEGNGSEYRWRMFAISTQDGTVTELTLRQTYPSAGDFVRPLAESNGTLLVKYSVKEELRTAEGQDGSLEQYQTYVPVYAMIDSADFFSNNPRFLVIA